MNRKSLLFLILSCFAFLAVSSPEQRTLTDPKSIASAVNPKAVAVPIDDLFYTRTVNGGAWSPDGRQVVFTTNLTGRPNLWVVASAGAWPIQLSQSDDRQYDPLWSPDGKWILYQQDKAGNEMYDLYAIPATGGVPVNLTNTADISEPARVFLPMEPLSPLRSSPRLLPCGISRSSTGRLTKYVS